MLFQPHLSATLGVCAHVGVLASFQKLNYADRPLSPGAEKLNKTFRFSPTGECVKGSRGNEKECYFKISLTGKPFIQ